MFDPKNGQADGGWPDRPGPTRRLRGLRRDLAAAAAQAQSRKRLFVGQRRGNGVGGRRRVGRKAKEFSWLQECRRRFPKPDGFRMGLPMVSVPVVPVSQYPDEESGCPREADEARAPSAPAPAAGGRRRPPRSRRADRGAATGSAVRRVARARLKLASWCALRRNPGSQEDM